MPERPIQPDPSRPSIDELIDRAQSPDDLRILAAGSPDARRHVEMQSSIDESLRRLFHEPARLAITPARRQWSFRWVPWAAAAALLLAGLVSWRLWTIAHRPDVLGPLYKNTVASGFQPEVVCTTDDEFANWSRAYLRQALYVTSRPADVQYVGWNKGRIISPISGVLLVKVGGEPVIVVLEREDRQTVVPGKIADPSLHRFERHIGDVVLYEVTPKDHASILPALSKDPAR